MRNNASKPFFMHFFNMRKTYDELGMTFLPCYNQWIWTVFILIRWTGTMYLKRKQLWRVFQSNEQQSSLKVYFCPQYHNCICQPSTGASEINLNNALYEACVQMNNEHSQERHLLARVLEYDTRVVRLAPEAIRSHYHSEVVYIHFSDCNVWRLSENLRKTWDISQIGALSQRIFLCVWHFNHQGSLYT